MPSSVAIIECRYISCADQQRYLDDGWELTPQAGHHVAYGVIASRQIDPHDQTPIRPD